MERMKIRMMTAWLLALVLLLQGCGSSGGNAGGDRTKVDVPTSADTATTGAAQNATTEDVPVPEPQDGLSATASAEEVAAFLAGGTWQMIEGGYAEGPASSELIFGADGSVTYRMPEDEAGSSYMEAKGSYAVSFETSDRPFPDILTLSFTELPSGMRAAMEAKLEDQPSDDFSFYIAHADWCDCLNLYITGNNVSSIVGEYLFSEMNQTSDTWSQKKGDTSAAVFDSGWVFQRVNESYKYGENGRAEPRKNADFHALIWIDGVSYLALTPMTVQEKTYAFSGDQKYYYFSYDGAPQIFEYNIADSMFDEGGPTKPYYDSIGRFPCTMAHVTTNAAGEVDSVEYYEYVNFMHWDKWNGVFGNGDSFGNFDALLDHYREVFPLMEDGYDPMDDKTFAGRLYNTYRGNWGDPLEFFSYAYADLNGDGTDEMMFGAVDENGQIVHQIFAIGKNDGMVHLIADAGYRTWLTVHTDNTILLGGSYSAASYSNYIYRLNESADDLDFVEGVYVDAVEDEDNPYFRVADTGQKDEYGDMVADLTPMTEQEADAMLAKYTEQKLNWTALGAGGGF